MLPFLIPTIVAGSVLATICAGVESLSRRGALGREVARKSVHVLCGSVTAALPLWLDTAQVVVLALFVLVAFGLSRRLHVLRCVHGEPGRGHGELVYCGAVAAVALSVGVGAGFIAAILTLAFADPAAALVGGRFGRRRLPGSLGDKSWAGTGACFVVAAAANGAVLLGATRLNTPSQPVAVVAVLLLAAAAAVAEAVGQRGWDNLSVPVIVAVGWLVLLGP